MRVEDIEIHAGDVADRVYREVKPVRVQVGAATVFSKTPTLDDVNAKLREEAVKLGANGIIQAAYDRGVTFRSWKGLKATGVAVVFETQGGSSETAGTAAELERLANLRDRGALTNEEFEVEKRKLLGS